MFKTLDKIYFGICGIVVAIAFSWLTYVYMEYRVVNMRWEENYGNMSPSEFWDIPTWSWKPVIDKLDGK